MDRVELQAWLRLQLTPGVGSAGARRLLTQFGLPHKVFQQTQHTLERIVSSVQASALLQEPPELAALLDVTWTWLETEPLSRRVLTLADPAYPQALLNIEDPPFLLYAVGAKDLWAQGGLNAVSDRCLAIVGSRNPTPLGIANAHQFAAALSQAGLTIVSGMALGVDGAAHEGALEGAAIDQVATIAIVGTGLDRVYPRQHRVLAHRIAQRGFLLSEYPLGTPPHASNFPQRNRIISGLCRGTLVVEAALQSGSLITARLATEQGKDVFAIPGSIHATQARGCHALIKQGAKLVECAQDVLEELQWSPSAQIAPELIAADAQPSGAGDLFDSDSNLLQALGFDPTSLDTLQARTGVDTPTLQAQLMTLELQGRVARLPGGQFQQVFRG
jgi:DNA processing protein